MHAKLMLLCIHIASRCCLSSGYQADVMIVVSGSSVSQLEDGGFLSTHAALALPRQVFQRSTPYATRPPGSMICFSSTFMTQSSKLIKYSLLSLQIMGDEYQEHYCLTKKYLLQAATCRRHDVHMQQTTALQNPGDLEMCTTVANMIDCLCRQYIWRARTHQAAVPCVV